MKRRPLNVLTALSLLLYAACVVTICIFPDGIERIVHRGSFGWRDGDGWILGGVGIYELRASGGPVVILSLPRGVLNFAMFVAILAMATLSIARQLGTHRAPGLCPQCGYDLRATPGQCPECGNVSVKAAS